jgi:hypothetical protein
MTNPQKEPKKIEKIYGCPRFFGIFPVFPGAFPNRMGVWDSIYCLSNH